MEFVWRSEIAEVEVAMVVLGGWRMPMNRVGETWFIAAILTESAKSGVNLGGCRASLDANGKVYAAAAYQCCI